MPPDTIATGLAAALGAAFELLGGEFGRAHAPAGIFYEGERFWFARVRAKATGNFVLSYTIPFPPAADEPLYAEYTTPFKIGPRGAPRLIPQSAIGGGSPYPHANVGDTLIVPVHLPAGRTGHAFTMPDAATSNRRGYFDTFDANTHEKYLAQAASEPLVRDDTGGRLTLLASWGGSAVNRPGTQTAHGIKAYMEFAQPGEFNITGHLLESRDELRAGMPVRVRAKDEPVTAFLNDWHYTEHRAATSYGRFDWFSCGVVEARVGDRVLVGCGGYSTPGRAPETKYRPGAATVRPFAPAKPYTPEAG